MNESDTYVGLEYDETYSRGWSGWKKLYEYFERSGKVSNVSKNNSLIFCREY